jgi:hypothetical protein
VESEEQPLEDFVKRSLQASSEWARFADPKLLGVLVLLGLGLTSLLNHAGDLADAHDTFSFGGCLATLCFWLGLLTAALTVACVSLGLFPRLRAGTDQTQSLFFFGGIAEYASADSYLEAVKKLDADDLLRELTHQAWAVAVVAERKHFWAKWAYRAALAFLLLWSSAMIGLHFS